jgi:hypothetical protein
MLVTLGDVNGAAAREYSNLLAQASRRGALDRDPNQVARVRAITDRLIGQTGVFRRDALAWQWEMHVISYREVNAWSMPGGKMAVYTGFLERLQPTDDELAAVIGHEIAHALREHTRERISERLATGLLLDVAISALGLDERRALLAELVTQVTFTLPNSRLHEQEADLIGVELAARAGFDPNGAVSLWQKMSRQGGGSLPEFLSTHPSPTTRVRDLRLYAQRVMRLYDRSRGRLARADAPPAQPRERPERGLTEERSADVAHLTVGSRPLATIFVNEERARSNPLVNYPLPAGPVRLRFQVTDTTGTWVQELTVTLSPGEQRNLGRISLVRPVAYLTVGSRPLATIFVNGERVSSNPIVKYAVPAGPVRLRFEVTDTTGTWAQELTVTLSPGEQRNLGRISLVRH